jgi:hypothetical protein
MVPEIYSLLSEVYKGLNKPTEAAKCFAVSELLQNGNNQAKFNL